MPALNTQSTVTSADKATETKHLSLLVDWERLRGKLEVVEDALSPRFKVIRRYVEAADDASVDLVQFTSAMQVEGLQGQTPTPSPSAKQMHLSNHRVKMALPRFSAQHIAVLGTGDTYRATTITANKWVCY